jgi:pimeloyl-ACP methyl ester carboxylesterase
MSNNKKQSGGGLLAFLTTVLVGAVGGWIAYSNRMIDHNVRLPFAIDANRERFMGRNVTRFMNYYYDTSASGRPLVFIHSINAAASAYEMKPLFQHYRGSRPVYALELPGFGLAERSDRTYSYQLYKSCIIDFLTERVGEPADVVGLSLSNEFIARAALDRPDIFNSIVMISPSGFTARNNKVATQQASERGTSDFFYRLLAFPLWSQAFYDLLTTKSGIRYFLQMSFEGQVDEGLADYDYLTSHQPGARYAPLYFVSGKLFSPRIREEVYERLDEPVLVLYDRDGFVSFDTLPETVRDHANWQATRISGTKGLPQFEKLQETAQAMDAFWASIRIGTA